MKKTILIVLLSLLWFVSCDEELTDNTLENQPPETNLYIFTEDNISQQQSQLNVHWWGDDPDGLVIGYYFSWDGTNWSFTDKNDSLFALQIGASDTNYVFSIAAVDNNGNERYDNQIVRNGIDLGAEPFVDVNNDGIYNNGEKYFDIGDVDPTPAAREFPIKNTEPVVAWNENTVLPAESFPAMTLRWEATDIDGDESIRNIYLALNDTLNPVKLDGEVRTVVIRTDNFDTDTPEMDVYINALASNTHSEKLSGLKFDDNNKVYVWAEDISGAKSEIVSLPDSGVSWMVHKPKGNVLLVDDYAETLLANPDTFYTARFNEFLPDQFDRFDIRNANLPYENITFLETIRLFDGLFWYSNNPNIDLAAETIQTYTNEGGNVFFSVTFAAPFDQEIFKSFILVDSIYYIGSSGSRYDIESHQENFPVLNINRGINNVRSFYPTPAGTQILYTLPEDRVGEHNIVSFRNNDNNIYYFGLSMDRCSGIPGSVTALLQHVFLTEFGLQ